MIPSTKSVFVCLLLAASAGSFAQHAGNVTFDGSYHVSKGVDLSLNNPNSYSGSIAFHDLLEANVMANVKANAYVAIFSATQNGSSIEEADSLMHIRLEAFARNLAKQGIKEEQIFIDVISMVPTYEFEVTNKKFTRTLNEKPTGFELKKNVHITFHDHNQANDLLTIAGMSEIYDLVKVDYIVDNLDIIYQQLRNEALTVLANKKASYEKNGIYLRFTNMGERFSSVYPQERYEQYCAAKTGAPPAFVNNAKKNATQNVQYDYVAKNRTVYYDKVPDSQFDKVTNLAVGQPMVQVYLSMKAQFVIYDPETEKENKEYKKKQREWTEREMEIKLNNQLQKPKEPKLAKGN